MAERLPTQAIPTPTDNLYNENKKVKKEIYFIGGSRNNTYRVSWKTFLIGVVLLGFIVLEKTNNGGYIDEVLGIASILYLVLFNKNIKRYDLMTLALIVVVVFIGLVSNLLNGMHIKKLSLLIDMLTQIKVILSFFFIKYFLSDREKQAMLELMLPLARIWCYVTFFFAILTQFINTGMAHDTRFGLRCFSFIFYFNFQYISVYMLAFAVILCTKKLSYKQKYFYYFISTVSIALDVKSQALIFAFLFVFLFFYLRKNQRIKPITIIIIVLAMFWIGQYQIDTYLSQDGAARHVFFEYAAKTANRFFPLGSGFATYGSAEAAKNYSPLYYVYGFDEVWGMSPDFRVFLTDTYWASVLGQFGWIGMALMIIIYGRIFVSFTNPKFRFDQKAFLYACYGQFVIHAIGSGIITSSSGMLGFIALALCSQTELDVNQTFNLPKVKIRL